MITTKDATKVRHLRRVNVGRRLRQNGRCSGHFSGVVLILGCSNVVAALVVCDPLCGGVTPLRSQGRRLVVVKVVLIPGCSKEPAPDRIVGVGSTIWVRVNRGEPRVEDTVKLKLICPVFRLRTSGAVEACLFDNPTKTARRERGVHRGSFLPSCMAESRT